ncbi:ABC transporter substrate-binding protein [Flavisolibacter nicotianae]|uniref:ABC transporter substrate-binding protein n=1 Tax=Flavisolibacter nicotianae TaxID=2364882 RepID=UPI000EB4A043|nr:helical backbone metal receptor [Flavisolibacter nicotianae]
MPVFTDQLNRTIEIPETPRRIISLVPSQTELLYDLGLDEEVIGITKFCLHPERWFRTKERIGGTKNLNREKICALQPDLIIANKEENSREQVDELAKRFPVWVSDVQNLDDALQMTRSIGHLTGTAQKAGELAARIETEFEELDVPEARLRTAYLIWKDPYMTVGDDTFIHHLLEKAGFQNLFAGRQRYPETSIAALKELNCEVLLLSSEPYPFGQKHLNELQALLPHTKVVLADGEFFSWYGSRLLLAPAYFRQLHRQIGTLQ